MAELNDDERIGRRTSESCPHTSPNPGHIQAHRARRGCRSRCLGRLAEETLSLEHNILQVSESIEAFDEADMKYYLRVPRSSLARPKRDRTGGVAEGLP